jgi:hypothetical protein
MSRHQPPPSIRTSASSRLPPGRPASPNSRACTPITSGSADVENLHDVDVAGAGQFRLCGRLATARQPGRQG